MGTLRSWMPLAGTLLSVARQSVARARTDSHGALAAIVFSAMGVEAAVNEILSMVEMNENLASHASYRQLKSLSEANRLTSRSASLEAKVQNIAIAFTNEALDRGRNPFQDFDLLLQLRNYLVHGRPEIVVKNEGGDWSESRLRARLVSRGLSDPTESNTLRPLMNDLGSAAVARWAYETSIALIDHLVNLLPDTFIGVALRSTLGRDNLALDDTDNEC